MGCLGTGCEMSSYRLGCLDISGRIISYQYGMLHDERWDTRLCGMGCLTLYIPYVAFEGSLTLQLSL